MRRWLAILAITFLLSVLCAGPIGCRNGGNERNEDLQDRLPPLAPEAEME